MFTLKNILKGIGWLLIGALSIILVFVIIFGCIYWYEQTQISEFEAKKVFAKIQENQGMVTSEVTLYQDSTFLSYTGLWPFGDQYAWGRYKIENDSLIFVQEYNEQEFLKYHYKIDTINDNLNCKGCEEMSFHLIKN